MSIGRMGLWRSLSRGWVFLLGICLPGIEPLAWAGGDICYTCQQQIRLTVYSKVDQVTRTKVALCGDCRDLPDDCYLCGVPVLRDFTRLPDGRVICKRDVRSVILDEKQAGQICEQVKRDLDRLLIRFLTLPETNVTVQLMDRVRLQEIYRVIGNDYSCPNTLGCTETKTNNGQRVFEISILSGQFKEDLITTCVHEYTHAWIFENVPPARLKTLGKSAVEGFCELLSYLFAEQQGLATGKSNILANHYTRGQIHLFIAANQAYGLADVVDWMKQGEDPLLLREDLSRVRRLVASTAPSIPAVPAVAAMEAPTNSTSLEPRVAPPQIPDKLLLQGIIWSPTRPMATLNGKTLGLKDEVTLTLREGLVTVRCVEIQPRTVVVETNGSPELVRLEMK